jgi:molecular chaperone Hsp33
MFQDYLFYGSDVETRYAFRLVHLSSLVQQAATRHGLVGARAQILGEVLTSGVLLSSILETEERVNLRLHMGSAWTAASETTCHAQTRGYLEASESASFLDQLDAGALHPEPVIVRTLRSIPGSAHLTEGFTESVMHSVEQVVNEHLEQSFQTRARVKVTCWFDQTQALRAYGAIYLELPHLAEAVRRELMGHVSALPSFEALSGQCADDPDRLAAALVPHPFRAINSVSPVWQCNCSQASVEGMLLSLPASELLDMAEKAEPVSVTCHYCNTAYGLSPERLRELSYSKGASDQAIALNQRSGGHGSKN